jgi:hypothetical protein
MFFAVIEIKILMGSSAGVANRLFRSAVVGISDANRF